MKIDYYDNKYEVKGQVELDPKLYEIKPDEGLIEEAVRVQLANGRTSIANTKTRGEVSGGGKKPWKQKGTGNARAGSTRSPIWRHGGITFGPRSNRNYSLKMNQKQWRKALAMVLSDKAANKSFIVIDEISSPSAKTREFSGWLNNLKKAIAANSKKFLVVLPVKNKSIERAVSNIPSVKAIYANSLNVVDIIDSDALLVAKPALEIIAKTYLK